MRVFLLAFVLGLGLVAQDDESGPASCSNAKSEVHKCACIRTDLCGTEPDKKCQTYCRPEACKCKKASCNSMKM